MKHPCREAQHTRVWNKGCSMWP